MSALTPRRSKKWLRDVRPFDTPAIVEVEWHDSFNSHGWDSRNDRLAEPNTASNCRSVGYLIKDDHSYVRVTESLGENDTVCCTTTIPKHAIRSLRVLRAAKK